LVQLQFMFRLLRLISGLARRLLHSRREHSLEYQVLWQQLLVLKMRHLRPQVPAIDTQFCNWTRRIRSGWKPSLILVSTETIVR
jgi:hypothetical protein